MVYTVVLNASYEIKSCALLSDFMFSCCFHVNFFFFLNNFFCTTGRRQEGGVSVQISNVESALSMGQ